MRKVVLVSSLSVGRCFTLAATGEAEAEEAQGATVSRTILAPRDAWKIVEETDTGFRAKSAAGEDRDFEGSTKVVEIPRQGFEKLASRK